MSRNPSISESYWSTEDKNPYPFYERVRAKGDVVWDEQMKAWLVVSADVTRKIMMDDELFIQPYLSMQAGEVYKKLRVDNPRSFQFLTGDDHRSVHRWWAVDLLSPKWVARYRSTVIEPVIRRALDAVSEQATFDLADDFAERIPIGVFSALMGFPRTDWEYLAPIKRLNDTIERFISIANGLKWETAATPEETAIKDNAIAAAEELNEMLRPWVHDRRAGTGDDFISRLWAGGPSIFPEWNEIDTLDACRRLLFSGSDTTTHAIANAFYMLLNDEPLRQRVADGDANDTARFVDELMRLNGSVHFRPRRAVEDVELGGAAVKKGDMLIILLPAANRDPEQFSCPHATDIDRPNVRNHLAFNTGPRVCPGSNLARAEVMEAVTQGLKRFPHMSIEKTGEPPVFAGFVMRSYRGFRVRTGSIPTLN